MDWKSLKKVVLFGSRLAVALAFSGACGPRGVEIAKGVRPDQVDPFSGDSAGRRLQARAAARSATLQCPIEGECEPAVALVAVATEKGLERCSGVLIAEDRVLTNDHCVNRSLSLSGWSSRHRKLPCKDSVFVHFSADEQRGPARAGCAEIEFRSGESGINSLDYAILKLDRAISDRKPLRVSKRGFRNHEPARILRVQMSQGRQNSFEGTQNFLRCQASHATFLYPLLNSLDTPLMTFGDCSIQAGNSGAPIVNEDGEIAGIIQGYLTLRQNEELLSELKDHLLDETYGQVGIGSQTRCMGELNPETAAWCRPAPPFTHFFPRIYLDWVGEFDESLLPKPRSGEIWSGIASQSSILRRYVSAPMCKKDEAFDSEEIQFKKGINQRLEAEWRPAQSSEILKRSFSLKDVLASGGGSYGATDGTTLVLPACR